MTRGKTWFYKDLQIKEGLKPGGKHFQYFFVVSEGKIKKCNTCVWIDDDTLASFSPSKDAEQVASAGRAEWSRWVQEKIDRQDFRNVVWKLEKAGVKEIDLSEMEDKLTME